MRKDSEKFLQKVLEYRKETDKNSFDLNYKYFEEIPSIETAIFDILKDLISCDCITSKSEVLDLDGNIAIYLTLDGITYFDDMGQMKEDHNITFNVSGGQINIAKEKANISAVYSSNMIDEPRASIKGSRNTVVNDNKKSNPKEDGMKVFISYSWTPINNKEWVEKLVSKLEKDGIQVVIDFKELKSGHDKFAFMERIVSDTTIKKVLIICNKTYKEKADFRSGGVGDESKIITTQVYGNLRQEKFIPVVIEHDEEGKPYLPNYLASRMYIDLTEFDRGYKELLSNILGENHKVTFEEPPKLEEDITVKRDIDSFDSPTPFFNYRFGKAFPGVRGLKEFNDPEECIDRLEILLRQPLNKKKMNMFDPIWWLRGSSNKDIEIFERLDKSRFLMDVDQIDVKRIIVFASPLYYKKFVYVESNPEKPTGLYQEVTQEQMNLYDEGYNEEYAVFNEHLITRAEYDDGAAVINGKVVDVGGQAKVRNRYLTPYNFIICAKWNPLNKTKYDNKVEEILYGMLKGTHTINDLTDFCNKLPRHHMDK